MSSISEILKDAEKDIKSILAFKNHNYLRYFMNCAYIPAHKLNLPFGPVPFSLNPGQDQYTPAGFWNFAKKISTFERKDIKALRLETLFIQALETVSAEESAIIVAMKDQTLHTLFPSITYETLKTVGYFQ